MDNYEEILVLASQLEAAAAFSNEAQFLEPIERLKKAAETIGRSASGSWLGYQANVYYADLQLPPPGAHFSVEWGLERMFSGVGSKGDWEEFNSDEITKSIYRIAGNPDITEIREVEKQAASLFERAKSDALSILQGAMEASDSFLAKRITDIESLETISDGEVLNRLKPQTAIMSRDTLAVGQGLRTPPHVQVLADIVAIGHTFGICRKASDELRKVGSHLERKRRQIAKVARIGTNVFIGHGRSTAWRELKDFIQDRAGLPWDEFNRIPVAGFTNITRLSEMLEAAAIAFLVMTGEDETVDGAVHARMNVIHEAGLFQGRLGFSRAIILMEEGCSEFTNIQGLGQIRFPKGRISAIFEEIRQVLEREGLLASP